MKIVLATDGSKYGQWAADLLLALPLAKKAEVTVLHVLEMDPITQYVIKPPLKREYSKVLKKEVEKALAAAVPIAQQAADRLEGRFRKVQAVVEKGRVAERIMATAREQQADLIVIGAQGHSDIHGFLIGSVSQKVATHAPCSVCIVHRKPRRIKKILMAVDGSRQSDAAAHAFARDFLPKGLDVTVLYVWDYPLHLPKRPAESIEKKYRALLKEADFRARTVCLSGHAAEKIVETARRRGIDLVVMGSRGLTNIRQFLLGSVSHKVIQHSHTSVLIVRPRG